MTYGTKHGVWSTAAAFAFVSLVACGHTDEEMAAKQREVDKLSADLRAAKAQIADDQANFSKAQNELERLKEQLKITGLGLDKTKEEKDRLEQAVLEYRQRAEQLAVIEARFRDLRAKLDKLKQYNVKVVPRNNRLVVQLPGDVLFDSGRDELKQQGRDVLAQIAEVVRSDKDLNNRFFLVAGHTDNVKYPPGGPFKDNWGLSLARARTVLLYLVEPDVAGAAGKKGGGLNARKWAAAGYAETDPIEGTVEAQNPKQQEKNRRVELVVQPNVEEMLNLGTIEK